MAVLCPQGTAMEQPSQVLAYLPESRESRRYPGTNKKNTHLGVLLCDRRSRAFVMGFIASTGRRGTVKNYAQIRLQIWQNKVCIGQDTALDIRTAEDGADVKGGVAACEALDV